MSPIAGPKGLSATIAAPSANVVPKGIAEQRAVAEGVQALGGAANLSAQSAVQSRQDAQAQHERSALLGRRRAVATMAALTPAATTHDEDEADAEREKDSFGRPMPKRRRVPKPPFVP